MANIKLTIDLTEENREILENIKTEKGMPYGNTVNLLIQTFASLPESVKKDLTAFVKSRKWKNYFVWKHLFYQWTI